MGKTIKALNLLSLTIQFIMASASASEFAGKWVYESEKERDNMGDVLYERIEVTIYDPSSCMAIHDTILNNQRLSGGRTGCYIDGDYLKVYDSSSGNSYFKGIMSFKNNQLQVRYVSDAYNVPARNLVRIHNLSYIGPLK